MTYTEVQQAVKVYKLKGLTSIKLNSSRTDLEAELLRLESAPVSGEVSTDEQVAKILPLAIEGRWFDMIASGEKKEEYRDIKPYYQSRFKKEWTHIKFTNGYGSDRSSFTIELLSVSEGLPKLEWSEGAFEQGSEVYVLELGNIVDANFDLPTQATYPDCATNLEGNYRIDSTPSEDELWLENLDGNGLPTEDYVLVDDAELARLKTNGQIWEYNSKLERWVPPYVPPNYQSTDDIQLTADDVDAEIEIFLGDVPKLSDEQLGIIEIVLNIADGRSITVSEALAQAGQFQLFTPNQLLSWGFDHIIPRSGMLARFRDAITKSQKRAIVCIEFSPNPENAALLTAWATSYEGRIYCRTLKDGYQHEEWGFSDLDIAEQFREYCSKLSFVQSATIETNALGVEISEKKLVEVVV